MQIVRWKSKIGRAAGLLLAAGVVLPPLVWLGAAAVSAPFHPGPPLLDGRARGLLLQSLGLALAAAVLALGIGVAYGWAVVRYRVPGRKLWIVASLLPLLLPPYGAAHAWSQVFSREGPLNALLLRWGWIRSPVVPAESWWLTAAILAFAYWPIIAWFTMFAARAIPGELEDTARLHLPDGAAARWAAWPNLRRALPAAALLVFLLALADFGVPNSLGLKVYPVLIVDRFQTDRDAGSVARLALPLLLLVVPLVYAQAAWMERLPIGGEAAGEPRLMRSPAGSLGGFLVCAAALAVSSLAPLGILAVESLPLRTYPLVWAESQDHFVNTAITAGGGALLALAVALVYGWVTREPRPRALDLALTLPYALPASLIGVAMIQLLNHPGAPDWLYSSLGGLVWMYAILFFPFANKALQPAWGHVDRDLLDEGTVLGANSWTQFRTAAWPAVRRYAVAGAAMVALLAAREIDATALLRIPGGDTIAFRIQDYLHFAPGPNVAALCVLLVLLSLGVLGTFAAWAWVGER